MWSELCGYANRASVRPVTRTTRFRVGSVSKTLTATVAARLVQRGTLDLDAPIQRYVKSFPRKRGVVSVRRLLAHTAGIRHYRGAEALSTSRYRSVSDAIRVFQPTRSLVKPGTRYGYSSYGFNLVGAAIEQIEERPFGAAVATRVLRPLGLRNTRLDDGRASSSALYEVTSKRDAVAAPRVDLSNRLPSGGYLSSAEDLARFGSMVADSSFLTPPVQRMFFQTGRAGGVSTSYGLGWETATAPFGLVIGHTGNVVGGTAFLLAHPGTRTAIAMTTNLGYVTTSGAPNMSNVARSAPALHAVRAASEAALNGLRPRQGSLPYRGRSRVRAGAPRSGS